MLKPILMSSADYSLTQYIANVNGNRYTYNAYKPGVKQQIADMAMNGSGSRDTGRVLGVSKDTVTAVLKNREIPRASQQGVFRAT